MNEALTISQVIAWFFALVGIGFSFYTVVKNNAKANEDKTIKAKESENKCSIETNTVLIRLDGIQSSIDRLSGSVSNIQNKMENLDHRLTVAETKLALGAVDGKNLNL